MVALYNPEDGRKEDSEEFYEVLQKVVNNVKRNDYIIIAGDFNEFVGNYCIGRLMANHGERKENKKGLLLIDFPAFSNISITNTFFPYKERCKYTWCAIRYQSIIDYVLVKTWKHGI